ncbi:MAG: hypothetical protein L6Q98_09315 [Anaerolineae bacterium]|nr:hypothetical protein [Anaerolineae bacterium]NUQ06212.1 hypothetical protein [Anaerolineae bacterium]
MVEVQPTCFERLLEIISALLLLFTGATSGPMQQSTPAMQMTRYTLQPVVSEYSAADLEAAAEVIGARLSALGYSGAQTEVLAEGVVVRLPPDYEPSEVYPVLTMRGGVEFVDAAGGEAVIGSADILSAKAQSDTFGGWAVLITLTPAGGEAMMRYTRDHIGDVLAVRVDDQVIAEPVINSAIGAEVMISGDFDESRARELAARIGFGALPFDFVIVSSEVEEIAGQR